MSRQADFLVRARDGRIVLVVEARSRSNAGTRWAAEFRRNLLLCGGIPAAPFFLLALPERFFLWTPQVASPTALPEYEVDPEDVLRPYLDDLQADVRGLGADSFDMLVGLWLDDVVHGTGKSSPLWLANSGLERELRGATITIAQVA